MSMWPMVRTYIFLQTLYVFHIHLNKVNKTNQEFFVHHHHRYYYNVRSCIDYRLHLKNTFLEKLHITYLNQFKFIYIVVQFLLCFIDKHSIFEYIPL